MGFRDYKYKWVSKFECNVNQWAKLRVMSVEDWPPISAKSMLNTMVERDDLLNGSFNPQILRDSSSRSRRLGPASDDYPELSMGSPESPYSHRYDERRGIGMWRDRLQ